MSRYGVLVIGPAGCGKSTFCAALIAHIKNIKRSCIYVNLDPAAEEFEYEPDVDIKDLISLEDVMDEMGLGPNGGLMACFEFLMDNLDWLESELGETGEESLTIFDCPGQIELYTHVPILPNLAKHLTGHMSFNLCAAYLLESTFVIDKTKFFAGTLSAMSCMIMLEIPHINILSKMDLVRNQVSRRELKRFLDPDPSILATDIHAETNPKFHRLNECVVSLIDDFSMVQFLQLESQNEDSVQATLSYIDDCLGWSEVQEPQIRDVDQDWEEPAED
ncbi:GPN-loop GTPase [Morchella snyderi]|nr:GPN-loop GTPase [Morchella snyderi]